MTTQPTASGVSEEIEGAKIIFREIFGPDAPAENKTLTSCVRAYRALSAKPAQGGAWADAPKDGTEILVRWSNGNMRPLKWIKPHPYEKGAWKALDGWPWPNPDTDPPETFVLISRTRPEEAIREAALAIDRYYDMNDLDDREPDNTLEIPVSDLRALHVALKSSAKRAGQKDRQ